MSKRSFDFLFAVVLMACSGAAALGWQFLWTQQLGSRLGHEMVAVLAVMAAFFAGLSLGSVLLGRVLAQSRWPGRWYAACEAVILLWGLVLYAALPMLGDAAVRLMGSEPSAVWHWCLAFGLPLLALLPATVAMGATLPALECQLRAPGGSSLGGIYAGNTLGAVAGLLLVVFVAVPLWGLQNTSLLCCGLNALCAVLAWALWGGQAVAPLPDPPAGAAFEQGPAQAGPIAGLLFMTGLMGIGYQVLAVRVLSQVTENTVFSYALILAVYLLGTSCGAAAYQWRFGRYSHAGQPLLRPLITVLSLAMLVSGISLWQADLWCALPSRWLGHGSVFSALAGEALSAAAALLLPSAAMGALFTHLCLQARAGRWTLGRALAVNTAGAALAPLVVGVWLLPAVGAGLGLAVLVLGYQLLLARSQWRKPAFYAIAGVALVWVALAPPLRFVDIPEGGRLLSYQEGVMASVSVVGDASGIAHLHINNRVQEGSSAASPVESRLALLPLLLQPRPTRALFLGLGTGYTSRVAAQDPALQVDAVELLPEVVQAASYFQGAQGALPLPTRATVRTVAADARRFVQASHQQYDLVVADLFHPARNGAGSLYTVEQFAAVRRLLTPQGLFCQWLAVHQMELDTLRSIVAAFLQVYPQGIAVLASNSLDSPVLGLVARPGQALLDVQAVQARLSGFADAQLLQDARLVDAFAVLGSVVADSAALARFARGQAANSDDRPIVIHGAPWATYAAQTTPRMRLMRLMEALDVSAPAVLQQPTPDVARRFNAYWQARNHYIQLGGTVRPGTAPGAMLAQLQAPLLDLLQTSPDFQPALDALLSLSLAGADSNPARSRATLVTLKSRYPQSRQVALALGRLP